MLSLDIINIPRALCLTSPMVIAPSSLCWCKSSEFISLHPLNVHLHPSIQFQGCCMDLVMAMCLAKHSSWACQFSPESLGGTFWAEHTLRDFTKMSGSALVCAGLATRDNMFDGLALGTMGGTYGAGPLACATANATLDVIVEENLLENATQRGLQLTEVGEIAAPLGLSAFV